MHNSRTTAIKRNETANRCALGSSSPSVAPFAGTFSENVVLQSYLYAPTTLFVAPEKVPVPTGSSRSATTARRRSGSDDVQPRQQQPSTENSRRKEVGEMLDLCLSSSTTRGELKRQSKGHRVRFTTKVDATTKAALERGAHPWIVPMKTILRASSQNRVEQADTQQQQRQQSNISVANSEFAATTGACRSGVGVGRRRIAAVEKRRLRRQAARRRRKAAAMRVAPSIVRHSQLQPTTTTSGLTRAPSTQRTARLLTGIAKPRSFASLFSQRRLQALTARERASRRNVLTHLSVQLQRLRSLYVPRWTSTLHELHERLQAQKQNDDEGRQQQQPQQRLFASTSKTQTTPTNNNNNNTSSHIKNHMKVRLQHVVRTIPLIGSLVEVVVVVGGGGGGGGVSDPKRRKEESAVARRGRGQRKRRRSLAKFARSRPTTAAARTVQRFKGVVVAERRRTLQVIVLRNNCNNDFSKGIENSAVDVTEARCVLSVKRPTIALPPPQQNTDGAPTEGGRILRCLCVRRK